MCLIIGVRVLGHPQKIKIMERKVRIGRPDAIQTYRPGTPQDVYASSLGSVPIPPIRDIHKFDYISSKSDFTELGFRPMAGKDIIVGEYLFLKSDLAMGITDNWYQITAIDVPMHRNFSAVSKSENKTSGLTTNGKYVKIDSSIDLPANAKYPGYVPINLLNITPGTVLWNEPYVGYGDSWTFVKPSLRQDRFIASDIKGITIEFHISGVWVEEVKPLQKNQFSLLEAPIVPYMAQDFSKPRHDFEIYINIVKQGTYCTPDSFINYNTNQRTPDLSFLREKNEDILLYIPVEWTNYAGYTQKFIEDYINIINTFNLSEITFKETGEHENFNDWKTSNKKNVLTKNEFYILHIKGESENANLYTIAFLQFLYLSKLNNIPGMFMQLLEKLKNENLTPWQVLLYTLINAPSDNYIYYPVAVRNEKTDSRRCTILNIFHPENTLKGFRDTVMAGKTAKDTFYELMFPRGVMLTEDKEKDANKQFLNYKQLFL